MGRKKQNKKNKNKGKKAQRLQQTPPIPSPPPTAAADAADDAATAVNSASTAVNSAAADAAAIKNSCEIALTALGEGKREAEMKIEEAATRFPDSALVQRVKAKISLGFSEWKLYSSEKSKFLSDAMEAAKKAAELSPKLIEYAHFLAKLMFDEAEREMEESFVNVVKECQRELSIEDPIDPRTERVNGDGINNQECSVENLRQQLSRLADKLKSRGFDKRFRFKPVDNVNDASEEWIESIESEGSGENVSVDLDVNLNVNVDSQDKNESLVESNAGEGSGENVSVDQDANVNANVESQDNEESLVESDDSAGKDKVSETSSYDLDGSIDRLFSSSSSGEETAEIVDEGDDYGTGLQNVGGMSSFLNVIIQSLRHIKVFRHELLKTPLQDHTHILGCVFCPLRRVMIGLGNASVSKQSEPVASTSLRSALKHSFSGYKLNNAHDVLVEILNRLHGSLSPATDPPTTEPACNSRACISHSFFFLKLDKNKSCKSCKQSVDVTVAEFSLLVSANGLCTAETQSESYCNCGGQNAFHHTSSNVPEVVTVALVWLEREKSIDDVIRTILAALSPEIHIGVIYPGLNVNIGHGLVSMVCVGSDPECEESSPAYQYTPICFAFDHSEQKWIMYNDNEVKVILTWEEVLDECKKSKFRPQVLFYEKAEA